MKILTDISGYPQNVSLILGFFDGIHLGHRNVIKTAVDYAKKNDTKSILITLKESPARVFNKKSDFKYIYPREYSYDTIASLGVDYIIENSLEKIANISANDYLENYIIKNFKPVSISTGFNHTFGANKSGNADLLREKQKEFDYKYFNIQPQMLENKIISSTYIKELLSNGCLCTANKLLTKPFQLTSTVISGKKLGREFGFPTANMKYPKDIIKIPYGVYKVMVWDMPAVLNWGVKPTVENKEEILEVHIPNYHADLYGKDLSVNIIDKIRDEKRFSSLEDLRKQIKKDIDVCLKL